MINIYNWLYIILFFLSCANPFSTRSAEEPENTQNAGIYIPPTEPDFVFVNLRRALEQKNIDEYMKCLINGSGSSDHTFHFQPEQYLTDHFVRPWSLEDEYLYFDFLIKSPRRGYPRISISFPDSIIFTPVTPTAFNDSLETNSFGYLIEIDDGEGEVRQVTGRAQMKLFRQNTANEYWYIYFWRDLAINNLYNKSWTYLKLFPDR